MTSPIYPAPIADLLREERQMPLGIGQPNEAVRARLAALEAVTAFEPHVVRDSDMAKACLAGLWLYHDFLPEAHAISQDIATPTGSYWHAILHRREGDFSNAKYWFQRVGSHSVFVPLFEEMQELASTSSVRAGPAYDFLLQESWDPITFVDLVEVSAGRRSWSEVFCRSVQQAEWRLLFAYSYQQAIGEAA